MSSKPQPQIVKSADINGSTEKPYVSPYLRAPKKFNFWRGIYNKDKNYILGRSPTNWFHLSIFYAVFYVILAIMFYICMLGLFATLEENEPTWQLAESRIGTNPGLGFRPISDEINRGALIWYNAKDQEHTTYWSGLLDNFLTPYINQSHTANGGLNQVHCDFNHPPQPGEVCAVDLTNFGDCAPNKGYGFDRSAPCFYMKLNRIFNWVPDYYDDVDNLPENMPGDLVEYIKSLPVKERKQVWISCNGENSADREIIGPIQYIPSRGFPGYYYPFTNTPGYLSPLIAVQFERPALHRIINIECRAWAKNIIYNSSFRDRQGSVHFEMMID